MQFFTYLGSMACIGLYFFTGENVEYGIACSVLASIGFAGSLVFYNGFLPEIASKDRMDSVSAKGFAMGYIGSVILLIINLILYQKYEVFGFEDGSSATRFGFILVGVWWFGFAQIAFYYLKDSTRRKSITFQIFGNDLTIDDIVWMGVKPTIGERASQVGILETYPLNKLDTFLQEAQKAAKQDSESDLGSWRKTPAKNEKTEKATTESDVAKLFARSGKFSASQLGGRTLDGDKYSYIRCRPEGFETAFAWIG